MEYNMNKGSYLEIKTWQGIIGIALISLFFFAPILLK